MRDRVGSDRGVGLGLSIVEAIAAVELVVPLVESDGMVGPGN